MIILILYSLALAPQQGSLNPHSLKALHSFEQNWLAIEISEIFGNCVMFRIFKMLNHLFSKRHLCCTIAMDRGGCQAVRLVV